MDPFTIYTPPPLRDIDIKLPQALDIGFDIPVMDTPRPPNALDELNASLSDSSGELYTYSPKDARPWKNGPVYSPYVDMEDAFAKAQPFTFGDVVKKTNMTVWNNLGASYTTLYGGVKELMKGNMSGFWKNEYSKELAEATKELEELIPMYRTKDERDNPFKSRNLATTSALVLPALGNVGATIADVYLGKLVALGVGAVSKTAGAATFAASLAKDSVALRNAFQGLYAIGKTLQSAGNAGRVARATLEGTKQLANTAKYKRYGQLLAGGLFYANAEAALQAEMNAQKSLEDQQAKYFKDNGVYATGEALEEIKARSTAIGTATYSLNLPLIASTQILQFGNLLMPKAFAKFSNPSIKLGEDFLNAAVPRVSGKGLKEFLADSASEGLEELLQSSIDTAVTKYYEPLNSTDHNTLLDVMKIAPKVIGQGFKDIQTTQGQMDFFGGALIGGLISGSKGTFRGLTGQSYGRQAQHVADSFNSTTQSLFEETIKAEYYKERLEEAFLNNNQSQVEDLVSNQAFAVAQNALYTGTIDARLDHLASMKDINIEDLNEKLKTDWTAQDRDLYVDSVTQQVKEAAETLEAVNQTVGTPKWVNDNWFLNLIDKVSGDTGRTPSELKQRLLNDAKAIMAYNLFKYNDTTSALDNIRPLLNSTLLNTDLEKAVADYKKEKQTIVDVNLPQDEDLIAFIEGLEGTTKEQYQKILTFESIDEKLMDMGLRLLMSQKLLADDVGNWQTEQGQRELVEQSADYISYMYQKEEQVAKEPENIEVDETVNLEAEDPLPTKDNVETSAIAPEDIPATEPVYTPEQKIKGLQEGEEVALDAVIQVKTDGGQMVEGLAVRRTKDGYEILAKDVGKNSYKDASWQSINKSVSNAEYKEVEISSIPAPQQRELNKRPTKKKKPTDLKERYIEELAEKLGTSNPTFKAAIKTINSSSRFTIICD